jgi:hypothetical protein
MLETQPNSSTYTRDAYAVRRDAHPEVEKGLAHTSMSVGDVCHLGPVLVTRAPAKSAYKGNNDGLF